MRLEDHWQLSAACRDQAPKFDAVIDGESERQRTVRHAAAVRICWSCEVRPQCNAHRDPARDFEVMAGHAAAVAKNVPSGGGQGVAGRPPRPIDHGTPRGYKTHERRSENPCGLCREAYNRDRADRKAKAS